MQTTNIYTLMDSYIENNGGVIPTFEKLGSKLGKLIGQFTVYLLIPFLSLIAFLVVKVFRFFKELDYTTFQTFKDSLQSSLTFLVINKDLVETTVDNNAEEVKTEVVEEVVVKADELFSVGVELYIAALDNQVYKILDKTNPSKGVPMYSIQSVTDKNLILDITEIELNELLNLAPEDVQAYAKKKHLETKKLVKEIEVLTMR